MSQARIPVSPDVQHLADLIARSGVATEVVLAWLQAVAQTQYGQVITEMTGGKPTFIEVRVRQKLIA